MDYNTQSIIEFIRKLYNQPEEFVPLHAPVFFGNEKKYVNECIDSTFVSSVGKFVDQFEDITACYTGAKYAVAVVNGTAALHVALLLADVKPEEEVITQALSFVATANAIKHANAEPVFIDVDKETLGMSPEKLEYWLKHNTFQHLNEKTNCTETYNKITGKRVAAIVPMHTFGHPCRIQEIIRISDEYHIPVVEDAAESLGSSYKGKHTGTFGKLGVFSYNGNKTITAGGGGMIITNDEELAIKAKHITTTAKLPHSFEFIHDEIGYNYRLTNINAALGLAQMEVLENILKIKQKIAEGYDNFLKELSVDFVLEPKGCKSNYWLNALIFSNKNKRDEFLQHTNNNGIMTRPIWRLLNTLKMFQNCQTGDLSNATWLEARIVNVPSGVKLK